MCDSWRISTRDTSENYRVLFFGRCEFFTRLLGNAVATDKLVTVSVCLKASLYEWRRSKWTQKDVVLWARYYEDWLHKLFVSPTSLLCLHFISVLDVWATWFLNFEYGAISMCTDSHHISQSWRHSCTVKTISYFNKKVKIIGKVI